MKAKLTDQETESLLPKIQRVLETGEPWEDDTAHYPAGLLIESIERIPFIRKDEDGFETNGWDWDWWQKFTYKGKSYTLSGSGFYGGHTFQPTEE